MTSPSPSEATVLLERWSAGDRDAGDRLLALVYEDVRRLAVGQLGRADAPTLQPTALANEAYLHLIQRERVDWKSRGHFLAVAARAVRGVLVDHLRARQAEKRGGGCVRRPLDPELGAPERDPDELLALDEALGRLATMDAELGRLVEMRFYGGMTNAEIAEVLGVSTRTVERGWRTASTFLRGELEPGPDGGA